MQALNDQYMAERTAITMPDKRVLELNASQKAQLARLGALNDETVVNDYRRALGFPPRAAVRSSALER